MLGVFLGRILLELGLGFDEERRRGEERRRKKEKHLRKMKGNRIPRFLYTRVDRVGPDPVHFAHALNRWILILVDPDQSNAPEAFWRSGSVCVFGFGLFTRGLWFLFSFLNFLAIFTPILAVWTPCAFKLFYEIPKKLPCVFGVFVTVFVIFYILKIDKNDRGKFPF